MTACLKTEVKGGFVSTAVTFLFTIILGEMLLTEIKITIIIKKKLQKNTKYQNGSDNTCFLIRK